MLKPIARFSWLVASLVIVPACGGSQTGGPAAFGPIAGENTWTWIGGSKAINPQGSYGTQGIADPSNIPGGRQGSVSWRDGRGNLWIFGGYGIDTAGTTGFLNDLWRFDGTLWTWMSGATAVNQLGSYGNKGTPSPANAPGSRQTGASWLDPAGNLWLFGGIGADSIGALGSLSDLWKFDGTNWSWVAGPKLVNAPGTYGSKKAPAPSNFPGARYQSASWSDPAGNFWLFGGNGFDSAGASGLLNDLWKFDGTDWTWISGANVINQHGAYGAKGGPSFLNVPGARLEPASWADAAGNFWLFGGFGFDASAQGNLGDLWRFDGVNWAWVAGPEVINQSGIYGTKGVAAGSNAPGSRSPGASWTDGAGTFWIFGGVGQDSIGVLGLLNDLWKFDGTNWVWVSGSPGANEAGLYGTQGTPSAMNVPGARSVAGAQATPRGEFIIFGGAGYDSGGASGYLNDVWRYQP